MKFCEICVIMISAYLQNEYPVSSTARCLKFCEIYVCILTIFSYLQDEHSVTSTAPVISRMELTRQRSIINRVSDEQKKWKGTVQEQRKNIYDRHSMLN